MGVIKAGSVINLVQLLFVLLAFPLLSFKTASTAIDQLIVTITNPDAHPCPGQPVNFTAKVTNGSTNLTYQWQVNGVNTGSNSPSFTIANSLSNPIQNTDIIQCVVTDNSNGASAASNKLSNIKVLITEKLYFQIFSQTNLPVCTGTQVLFGSSNNNLAINGISNLLGVWSVNGVAVHTGLTFVYDSPKDGDVVTCEATFIAKCTTAVVESNSITLQIITPSPSTVTVSPADYKGCVGAPVTFNATVNNGGDTKYQWMVNGQNVGTNNSQFTSSDLKTGDQVSCNVTTNRVCIFQTVQSNVVPVTVLPQSTNSVSITCDAVKNFIVEHQLVTFTAQATYAGPTNYQWQVNGKDVGTNNPVFKDNNLTMGDVVTCFTTTSDPCVLPQPANSNAITILMHVPLSIPNAFTPNGDGINDTWNIKALLIYPTCNVKIFDRYGGLVYQSVGYPKAWDGNFNGKQLPTGVYYYLINLNDGSPPYSGYVTIIR
ncbi:MAG TPA: gliding motility-associated C-terminal domain-containing protein [Mucilaginibacter sp.]|nr:gliding motility-associated C-terminal domain-containing protein [Mucilaginibacter sp.]